MLSVSPADLARYAIRPLIPGPLEVLRETVLGLGVPPAMLGALSERGAVEALAVEGLQPDQTRVLERKLAELGGTVIASEDAARAVLLGSLSAFGTLPSRLVEWGRNTEALGAAISAAVLGKGGAPQPLTAGRYRLEFGHRTLIMGIVNTTPDSFSGDGTGDDTDAAVAHGLALVEQGAGIIDIGGESTRPNSKPVDEATEMRRVLPAVEALSQRAGVPVSIDTRKAAVARAAIECGADIVNDVWGLRGDPGMAGVIAAAPHVAVVAMHNRRGGEYDDLMAGICAGLRESLVIAARAGIDASRVVVDPGFGFGMTPAQNIEMIRRLGELRGLARPILVGPSRKSTIGMLLGDAPPEQRVEGTIALAVLAAQSGAGVIRVHDVQACVRALRVADAVLHDIPAQLRAFEAPGPTG